MPAMPSNPDSLSRCPSENTGSDRIDDSGDFVPGDSGVLNAGEGPFLCERVAVAYAASLNFDSYRSGARGRDFALDKFKGSFRVSDLHTTHLGHRSSRSIYYFNNTDSVFLC
jgi:hypothetical protein